jgi:hypothetical protein
MTPPLVQDLCFTPFELGWNLARYCAVTRHEHGSRLVITKSKWTIFLYILNFFLYYYQCTIQGHHKLHCFIRSSGLPIIELISIKKDISFLIWILDEERTFEEVLKWYHVEHSKKSWRLHGLSPPQHPDKVGRLCAVEFEDDLWAPTEII